MSETERRRASAGLVIFTALCLLGSWSVAATLRVLSLNVHPTAMGTRLFTTLVLYALTMGWQPFVATWIVRRWVDPPGRIDLGLRRSERGFNVAAFALGASLVLLAALVALALAALGWMRPLSAAALEVGRSGDGMIELSLAAVGTLLLGAGQAFTEEVGWRGYFLLRAMQRFGRWRGLALQGLVWALWYAPVVFFTCFGELDARSAIVRSASFTVSCAMLGVVLGWLRLAAQSLGPAVIANSTLTFAAGLPYLLHGMQTGARGALFGPAGWLVLLGCLALASRRWEAAVQTPTVPRARFERERRLDWN
ncbi:MAG: CPBP family intramembrane glutamic endopeptidase [Polyangiales bacterium]